MDRELCPFAIVGDEDPLDHETSAAIRAGVERMTGVQGSLMIFDATRQKIILHHDRPASGEAGTPIEIPLAEFEAMLCGVRRDLRIVIQWRQARAGVKD